MRVQNTKVMAILLIFISTSLFAFADVIVKTLSDDLNAYQIGFWIDAFALIIFLTLSKKLGGFKNTLQSKYIRYHLLRSTCLSIGYVALLFSLIKMSLAETHSLFFTCPIFGVIFSAIILKERIKYYHVIAIIMGFIGVLIILRPGLIALNTDLFYPLFAALMFGMGMVFNRKIPDTETKLSFVLYPIFTTLCVTGLLAFPDFGFGNAPLPTLALTGLMTGTAVLLVGLAYAKAPTAVVAPIEYVRIVWGIVLGYFVFGDILGTIPAIGAGVIITSGLYLIYCERK